MESFGDDWQDVEVGRNAYGEVEIYRCSEQICLTDEEALWLGKKLIELAGPVKTGNVAEPWNVCGPADPISGLPWKGQ